MSESQESMGWENEYALLVEPYDFTVKAVPGKGKGVVAKRCFQSGEDVLEEMPLVAWPIRTAAAEYQPLFCENCLCFATYDDPVSVKPSPEFEGRDAFIASVSGTSKDDALTASTAGTPTPTSAKRLRIPRRSQAYLCSQTCRKAALGHLADNERDSDALGGASNDAMTHDMESKGNESSYIGGWMRFLSFDGLVELRKAQLEQDPTGELPITVEALGRAISKIASTTQHLHVEMGLPLSASYTLAWRHFDRLLGPEDPLIDDFDLEWVHSLLMKVMGKKIEACLGSEIHQHLSHFNTLVILLVKLVLNSQSLNIWGALPNGDLSVLRAGAVYILQSCFNHSCIPNCAVSCMSDATITVTTLQPLSQEEELSISYIPTDAPLAERRELLRNYMFQCTCAKCIEEAQLCS